MLSQRSIPCGFDPQTLILTPGMNIGQNVTNATVDMRDDGLGGKSGTLSFGGGVKAFLTFDDSGRVIGYTLADYNVGTQSSVENILAFI